MVQSRTNTKEKAAKDYATLKLHAARWCWNRKHEKVPPAHKITWEEWFNEKWGEPLQQYAATKIAARRNKENGEDYQN